jgi:hypothetical protein
LAAAPSALPDDVPALPKEPAVSFVRIVLTILLLQQRKRCDFKMLRNEAIAG